jgi:hypothetical protein
VLVTNDKYALPLPLIILALAKELIRASKVLKVPIFKTIKPKKLANKID